MSKMRLDRISWMTLMNWMRLRHGRDELDEVDKLDEQDGTMGRVHVAMARANKIVAARVCMAR